MSARSRVQASTETVPLTHEQKRSGRRSLVPMKVRPVLGARSVMSSWSGSAWGVIGITLAYIGLTCWWLTQDRSVPIYDAGDHLWTALHFHEQLRVGDLLGPFNYESPYPPLGPMVGALAAFIGGVNVAAPIIGENLVFVSLLTLGCYQTGRLLFGARAGLLAAIFVLGSPLIIAQSHVFMLDVPETAIVAVSMWLILASRRFERVGISGLAGLVVGAGFLIKVQYPFFVLGIVLCALALGGWRNRRGFLTFAAVVIVVGSPWYLAHLAQISTFTLSANGEGAGVVPSSIPPTFSVANATWYMWITLNAQLLAPLFVLLVIGAVWMMTRLLRRRDQKWGMTLELIVGLVVAWLAATITPHHDIRYGIPFMPYLAVIATGWMTRLPRGARAVSIAALVTFVALNTLGATFGAGGNLELALVKPLPASAALASRVRIYNSEGFLVAGPRRDGDILGLLKALRRNGVRSISWSLADTREADFSFEGLLPLTLIAGLKPRITRTRQYVSSSTSATLLHGSASASQSPPCRTLSDGTRVYVIRQDPAANELKLYCPSRHPRYY